MISLFLACSVFPLASDPSTESSWHLDYLGPAITTGDGRIVNAAAHYWTDIVGVPFDRDASVVVRSTPIDLDLDGKPDTSFEGQWDLPGGILENPKLVGLVPTPDDPKGAVGDYSISTGFLGIREEKDEATHRGTGRFGFTCWLCHGANDDSGRIILGKPNVNIYLGLILASSKALDPLHVIREFPDSAATTPDELRRREHLDASFNLDPDKDGQVTIAEWRAAMKLPSCAETRAEVLLAGPGRLDQSVDHRMDGTIPLAQLQQYTLEKVGPEEFLRKAKLPKRSVFNPVSLPQTLAGLGVSHYAWTGKDSSVRLDALKMITEFMHNSPNDVADLIRFPRNGTDVDYEALSRAITLDFRNVGTFSREADEVKGNWWSHEVLTKPSREILVDDAARYGAVPLRELLTKPRVLPATNDPAVTKGRSIFVERTVGEILNQRVLIGREALAPDDVKGIAVIAPLDRSKPITARIPVHCATCHNYSPLSNKRKMQTPIEDFQRCDLCHFDHPDPDNKSRFLPISEHMKRRGLETVDACLTCHENHPDFGPQAFSNSWLLPLDADEDGQTHGDEVDDSSAGGIGTDGEINIDSLFVVQIQPPARRPKRMYLVSDNAQATPVKSGFSTQGYGWVRVAPLSLVGQTGPYLHNGSVPSLDDLLLPMKQRPARFRVGTAEQNFAFDTNLPGNRNCGHNFGFDLPDDEKQALIQFLKSIP